MIVLSFTAIVAAIAPFARGQLPPCPLPTDGYTELLRPPTLDENSTGLEFSGQDTNFKTVLLIPKQFNTMAFDFEGTTNTSAAYDSANPGANQFWTIDAGSDSCNYVCTLFVPWELLKDIDAVTSTRFSDSVRYRALIQINTSMPITVEPNSLLEASGQSPEAIAAYAAAKRRDVELDQSMNFTRNVNTKIPFEVTFDLLVNLTDSVEIQTPTPWITAALIESTLIDVDPDADPLANARLVFVTVIPGTLLLNDSAINVTSPDLRQGLNISEILELRNCSIELQYCVQHWLIDLEPRQCTLDGVFTARLTGTCNPDPNNFLCYEPIPNYADIIMTVTSDDFCGVTQVVDLQGSLSLVASQCNDFLTGTVTVYSNTGAAMNRTDIVRVSTSPTLQGGWFLVFENATTSELSYSANMTDPHVAVFSFLWLGSQLKCDVVATVECTVVAEFQATAPTLLTLDGGGADGHGDWKRSKQRSKYATGPRLLSTNEVQTSAETGIAPANTPVTGGIGGTNQNQNGINPGQGSTVGIGGQPIAASTTSGGMSTTAKVLVVLGFAVIAATCCCLCCGIAYVVYQRQKHLKAPRQLGGVAGAVRAQPLPGTPAPTPAA